MSILGYSASYFLPEYWASTPFYGEKIIPLIDYILSTDFEQADKLATAFYAMTDKYKNTSNLPIDFIKEIITESGYDYVLQLLGNDTDSIRLLVYLIVLIHQLKSTELGIEVVLGLFKRDLKPMILATVGNLIRKSPTIYSGFSTSDFLYYRGFTVDASPFEVTIPVRIDQLRVDQCIASVPNYGLYLGLDTQGHLVLSLGSKGSNSWNIAEEVTSTATLVTNSTYNIKFSYDGHTYLVQVSSDEGKLYTDYITVEKSTPTNFHEDWLYLGIDHSEGVFQKPFKGDIDIAPLSMNVSNVEIEKWFEQFPVGNENTFIIKTDLDLGVVSVDFFKNFSNFIRKYVYPSLQAFEARLKLDNDVTFIPYSRQKIKYVAMSEANTIDQQIEAYLAENN